MSGSIALWTTSPVVEQLNFNVKMFVLRVERATLKFKKGENVCERSHECFHTNLPFPFWKLTCHPTKIPKLWVNPRFFRLKFKVKRRNERKKRRSRMNLAACARGRREWRRDCMALMRGNLLKGKKNEDSGQLMADGNRAKPTKKSEKKERKKEKRRRQKKKKKK